MSTKKFTLSSRLASLPSATTIVSYADLPEEKRKKQARIAISLEKTSDTVGFLHAVLLELDGLYFLVAGPSGVGKSTLADSLHSIAGAGNLSSDWVAVEKLGDKLYASDLNYAPEIRHTAPCYISGIIFLAKKDIFFRDAFVPNDSEFGAYVASCFDDMNDDQVAWLSQFWLRNQSAISFYCVLPTLPHEPSYVAETLLVIMQRTRPVDSPLDVGVIGIGAIGTALSNELGKVPMINHIHLYNRSKEKALGLAIDLNHALYNDRNDIFISHDSALDLFRRSSIVFISFRETDSSQSIEGVPERWKRLKQHSVIIRHYAQIAATAGFTGTVFVITNPVDYLSYDFYEASQTEERSQRTFQVYGIGLEADIARAVFYAKRFAPNLQSRDVSIFGNHSDDFSLHVPLADKDDKAVTELVKGASEEVRSHNIRTIYGPVAAIMRTFNAFIGDQSAYLTAIQEKTYIGRRIQFKFGLPMLPESIKLKKYDVLVAKNRRNIAAYHKIIT